MNWEQAYREECKKLEDVRNELKEREEQICEMQLLLDKANEKLKKVHFSEVVSPAEPDSDEIKKASYDYVDGKHYIQCPNNARDLRKHFESGAKWMFNWQKAKAGSGGTPV